MFGLAPEAKAVTFISTGNPGDTASGEVITAFATQETLDYTDINSNPKPQVTPPSNIAVTVLPEYGFSAGGFGSRNLYVAQTITNSAAVTNEGNASDNYTIGFSCNFANAGAGAWTVNIRRSSDNSLVGTLTPGNNTTSEVKTVAEDADYGFYHQVTAPANGSPTAYIVITSTATTASTPVGQYTGANGLTYGGPASWSNNSTYTIVKPLLTLTRSSVVDAPKISNPVGYTGGTHDTVPGSIITYTLSYTLTGDAANSAVIVDKVPDKTNLAHFNATGSTTNVIITASRETDINWTVFYSTLDSPDKSYQAPSGWTFVGTIDAVTTGFPSASSTYNGYPTPDAPWNAKWVKWEKANVPVSGFAKTITWGATVR